MVKLFFAVLLAASLSPLGAQNNEVTLVALTPGSVGGGETVMVSVTNPATSKGELGFFLDIRSTEGSGCGWLSVAYADSTSNQRQQTNCWTELELAPGASGYWLIFSGLVGLGLPDGNTPLNKVTITVMYDVTVMGDSQDILRVQDPDIRTDIRMKFLRLDEHVQPKESDREVGLLYLPGPPALVEWVDDRRWK